jgi:hypothetical protein
LTETLIPALLPLLQVRLHLSISQPASQLASQPANHCLSQPLRSQFNPIVWGRKAIAGTSQQNLKSFPGRCGRYTLHSLPLSVHPRLFCLPAHSYSHTSASALTGLALSFSISFSLTSCSSLSSLQLLCSAPLCSCRLRHSRRRNTVASPVLARRLVAVWLYPCLRLQPPRGSFPRSWSPALPLLQDEQRNVSLPTLTPRSDPEPARKPARKPVSIVCKDPSRGLVSDQDTHHCLQACKPANPQPTCLEVPTAPLSPDDAYRPDNYTYNYNLHLHLHIRLYRHLLLLPQPALLPLRNPTPTHTYATRPAHLHTCNTAPSTARSASPQRRSLPRRPTTARRRLRRYA